MILILGCGRSGTHLLADVLEGPDTVVTKEDPRWFDLALAMVRNKALLPEYYPRFAEMLYREHEAARADGKVFVDKTHVAAWLFEWLAKDLPLYTIWIERDPLPTIASMTSHPGMRNDLRYARCFTVPNRYMGIEDEMWFDLPIVQCFAHKWISYHRRLIELYGRIDHFVKYEELLQHPEREITKIEEKFGIRCSRPVIFLESLSKWQQILAQAEVSEINELLEDNIE